MFKCLFSIETRISSKPIKSLNGFHFHSQLHVEFIQIEIENEHKIVQIFAGVEFN